MLINVILGYMNYLHAIQLVFDTWLPFAFTHVVHDFEDAPPDLGEMTQ